MLLALNSKNIFNIIWLQKIEGIMRDISVVILLSYGMALECYWDKINMFIICMADRKVKNSDVYDDLY